MGLSNQPYKHYYGPSASEEGLGDCKDEREDSGKVSKKPCETYFNYRLSYLSNVKRPSVAVSLIL